MPERKSEGEVFSKALNHRFRVFRLPNPDFRGTARGVR